MRLISLLSLVVFSLLVMVDPALAEEAAKAPVFGEYAHLGAGLGIGIAMIGAGLGLGKIGSAALDGIGRNPGASGAMFVPLLIGLAMIEGLGFFAVLSIAAMAGTQ